MKKQRILSLVLVLAMVMSMLTFNITVSAQDTATTVDPLDFSAFEAYGAYVYASQTEDAEIQSGVNVLSYDDTRSYDNRIYHMVDDLEEINADTALKGAYDLATASSTSFEYVTRSVDGAWGYKTIGGKNAFWTTRNARNRSDSLSCSSFYIQFTNDVVNENVNNLTFLIEYYDNKHRIC